MLFELDSLSNFISVFSGFSTHMAVLLRICHLAAFALVLERFFVHPKCNDWRFSVSCGFVRFARCFSIAMVFAIFVLIFFCIFSALGDSVCCCCSESHCAALVCNESRS